jgi:DNA helicase HerA-like ATPase
MITIPNKPFVWFIAGKRGSGKSYFAGYLIERYVDQNRNGKFVVMDWQIKNHIGLIKLKNTVLLKIKENVSYDWKKIIKYPRIVIIPAKYTPRDTLKKAYSKLIEVLMRYDKNRLIVLEEAHNLANLHYIDPNLEYLTREGRHDGHSMLLITQKIQEFNKLIWTNTDCSFIFKHMAGNDIDYIEKTIKGFRKINSDLRKHDLIRICDDDLEPKIIRKEEIIRVTKHYG